MAIEEKKKNSSHLLQAFRRPSHYIVNQSMVVLPPLPLGPSDFYKISYFRCAAYNFGSQKIFWAKHFFYALFTSVKCAFLKSVWKEGFFKYHIRPIQSVHLIEGSMCTFCKLKSPKWKQPVNISANGFIYKTGLRFSSPFQNFISDIWASKSLCPTLHSLPPKKFYSVYGLREAGLTNIIW